MGVVEGARPDVGSSEASAPQRLKCISIQTGAAQLSALGTVSFLGRVRFRRFHYTSMPKHFQWQ